MELSFLFSYLFFSFARRFRVDSDGEPGRGQLIARRMRGECESARYRLLLAIQWQHFGCEEFVENPARQFGVDDAWEGNQLHRRQCGWRDNRQRARQS